MKSSVFPECLKEAVVKSLLKKITMELIDRNYRPVSNLQFTGKLIEHVVTNQLNEHITWNRFMEPMQSAYRSGYNTETTLLKVCDDMLRALDNQEVMFLVLLDLSAAIMQFSLGIWNLLLELLIPP